MGLMKSALDEQVKDQRSDLQPTTATAKMARCLSFTAAKDWCHNRTFSIVELRTTATVLSYDTTTYC